MQSIILHFGQNKNKKENAYKIFEGLEKEHVTSYKKKINGISDHFILFYLFLV